DVAQRPEAFVGKAVVVALLLFRSEPDAPNKVGFLAGRNAYARVPVGGLAVRGAAAMGDPHARTGAHNRLQGGDQAARRMNDGDPPIPGALVNVRLAVGDDDHLLAVQVPVQRLLQALGRPGATLAVRLLLGNQAIDEIANVPEDGFEFRPLRPGDAK